MMTNILLAAGAALLSLSVISFAQVPPASGERQSAIFRCDALAGAEKEECLRGEERRKADRSVQGSELRGSCDMFIGLERERCLQQGGTVEAGAKSSGGAGGTRPPLPERR
jgi:hypothetical protein